MTKYGRPLVGRAGVEDLGDVRVVHQREGLPLRLEARERPGRESIPGLMTFSATLRSDGLASARPCRRCPCRLRRSAGAACRGRSTVPGPLRRRRRDLDGRRPAGVEEAAAPRRAPSGDPRAAPARPRRRPQALRGTPRARRRGFSIATAKISSALGWIPRDMEPPALSATIVRRNAPWQPASAPGAAAAPASAGAARRGRRSSSRYAVTREIQSTSAACVDSVRPPK